MRFCRLIILLFLCAGLGVLGILAMYRQPALMLMLCSWTMSYRIDAILSKEQCIFTEIQERNLFIHKTAIL